MFFSRNTIRIRKNAKEKKKRKKLILGHGCETNVNFWYNEAVRSHLLFTFLPEVITQLQVPTRAFDPWKINALL